MKNAFNLTEWFEFPIKPFPCKQHFKTNCDNVVYKFEIYIQGCAVHHIYGSKNKTESVGKKSPKKIDKSDKNNDREQQYVITGNWRKI